MLALGHGVGESHQTVFTASLTRMRRTVTHSAGDGTGLGLYLVEEIVSEHHGCIAVENRAEGGTRFSIWLPLTDAQEVT